MNPREVPNNGNQSKPLRSPFLDGPPEGFALDSITSEALGQQENGLHHVQGSSEASSRGGVNSPQRPFRSPFLSEDLELQAEMDRMVQEVNGPSEAARPNAQSGVNSPQRPFYSPFLSEDPAQQAEMDRMVREANGALDGSEPNTQDSVKRPRQKFYSPLDFDDPEQRADVERMVREANRAPDGMESDANSPDATGTMKRGASTTIAPTASPELPVWHSTAEASTESPDALRTVGPLPPSPQTSGGLTCTDAGTPEVVEALATKVQRANNEYELMEEAASKVPFVVWRKEAYVYNGLCYEHQEPEDVEGVILELCRENAVRIGKYNPIKNAYKLISIDKRFRTSQEWLDHGKKFVTFLNGNLDLETGCLSAHSPSIFTTHTIQANYLGRGCAVESPVFDRLLNTISGGDANIKERILQMIGYCLTSDTAAKVGFLLQGVTNSGKSLLCNFIASFFLEDEVAAIPLHSVGDRFATAELYGVALCITPDLPSKPLSDRAAGMIKALSGNDLIQADRKYRSYTKFRYQGKFIMATNHALLTSSADDAFENRIVVVPFLYSVPREDWDPQILNKLALERDAVVSKSIDAYFRLRGNHYIFAGNYALNADATVFQNMGRQHISPELVFQFVCNSFEAAPGMVVYVADAYAQFCRRYQVEPSLAVFGKYFGDSASRRFGGISERKRRTSDGNPISCVSGIRLKTEENTGYGKE